MDKVYLTQEKYTKILTELNQLKTVGRNEVAKRLKQAKELGDLSENSEYQEAREQYSRAEQKIAQLEELIRNALIINSDNNREASSGIIRIGSRVTIMKDDSEEVVYVIVGSQDADPVNGRVSNESPIGKSLLGLSKGGVARIRAPKGDVSLKIIRVE